MTDTFPVSSDGTQPPAGRRPSDDDPRDPLEAARDLLGRPLSGEVAPDTAPPSLVWEPVVPGAAPADAIVPNPDDVPNPDEVPAGTAAVEPAPAIDAELDRRAFAPDGGATDVGSTSSISPSLPSWAVGSSPSQAAGTDDPSGAPTPTASMPPRSAPSKSAPRQPLTYAQLAAQVSPRTKRRRLRRFVGRVVTLLVFLGLIGGGLVVARHFLLEPQWADDVRPLAEEVAAERGLEFTASLPVVELSSVTYPAALGESMWGVDASTIDTTAGEWRALGVLDGILDPTTIGQAAIPDAPAFYDPASATINVLSGLQPELRTFALHRALAVALLDQNFGWWDRSVGQPAAVIVGTRMLYEADALATALALVIEPERVKISNQLLDLYTTRDIPPSPSPYASTVIGRLGVALWPWFRDRDPLDRSKLLLDATQADATLLDLDDFAAYVDGRADVDPTAVGAGARVGTPPRVSEKSRGALFWYHVLAARIDDDLAWRAAVGWENDEVASTRSGGAVCVTALFEADASAAAAATDAFGQWSALSPLPVSMLVTERAADPSTGASTGVQVSIEVCDPGTRIPTNDGSSRLLLGGAPLRIEQLRRLLDERPELSMAAAACIVGTGDAITILDERGVIDGVDGWAAPDGHPPLDPANPACAGL